MRGPTQRSPLVSAGLLILTACFDPNDDDAAVGTSTSGAEDTSGTDSTSADTTAASEETSGTATSSVDSSGGECIPGVFDETDFDNSCFQ